MGALALNLEDVHQPTPEEIVAARDAARTLAKVTPGDREITLVDKDAEPDPIKLPANVFRTLLKMLVEIGNGNAVAVVPVQAELTTQQAADLMNISRPHLIRLLGEKALPFRMVGTHRKLLAKDVLNYKQRVDLERDGKLAAIAQMDQDMGLYDDEPVSDEKD